MKVSLNSIPSSQERILFLCNIVMSRLTVRSGPLTPYLASLSSMVVVLSVVMMALPQTSALCEDRCTLAQPPLWTRLRALWSRSFKRVGEKRVSFEEFMLSLVQASDTQLPELRAALLNLIGWYQDCVMACEHPFSKRDNYSISQSTDDWRKLCPGMRSGRRVDSLLSILCVTYSQ